MWFSFIHYKRAKFVQNQKVKNVQLSITAPLFEQEREAFDTYLYTYLFKKKKFETTLISKMLQIKYLFYSTLVVNFFNNFVFFQTPSLKGTYTPSFFYFSCRTVSTTVASVVRFILFRRVRMPPRFLVSRVALCRRLLRLSQDLFFSKGTAYAPSFFWFLDSHCVDGCDLFCFAIYSNPEITLPIFYQNINISR